MTLTRTPRPTWLTFDCYGTLIQWDEGVRAAVRQILAAKDGISIDDARFLDVLDRHEHRLEQIKPHLSFRTVTTEGLNLAFAELGVQSDAGDARIVTDAISAMPPFPEVVETLRQLKQANFNLCIISNTDDDIIAGNVAQLGGLIDRVITAQQAQHYKPSPAIFEHAWRALDVTKADIVHICASPHLDHAAAREMGFRCIWIDRGTGRTPLPDYTPDQTLATLDQVLPLFRQIGWIDATSHEPQ